MPLILGTNSIKDTGFDVGNSCMFGNTQAGASATDYLTITPGSASNRRTFTISYWVKRGTLNPANTFQQVIGQQASNYFRVGFGSNEQGNIFRMYGRGNFEFRTKMFARDVAAWYHVCLAIDTTQGTAANRAKLYINGVQQTEFYTENYPDQNTELDYNLASAHVIGRSGTSGDDAFNGYLAQFVSIDGSALAADQFGEFDSDSGIWKPIDVSGLTFGTNGFFLDFADSGDLGDDESGNGNDFTETGIDATNQSTDTCTNNFATLNPLNPIVHAFEEGNLRIDGGADNWDSAFSTIGASSGKWYFEMKFLALEGGLRRAAMGLVDARGQTQFATNEVGYNVTNATGDSVGYNGNGTSNTIKKNDSAQYNGTEWSVNDIICMAVDLDNSAVYFRVNGSAWLNSGNPESGASKTGAVTITAGETYVFGGTAYGSSTEWEFNFGSPCYSESGGNSDGDGYGNFEYDVPAGYFALNTKNLAEYG